MPGSARRPLRAGSLLFSVAVAGVTSQAYLFGFDWTMTSYTATTAMTIWRYMASAQSVATVWVLWHRIHPGLLPLLNADLVRLGAADVPLRYAVVGALTPAIVCIVSSAFWNVSLHATGNLVMEAAWFLSSVPFIMVRMATTAYMTFLVDCLHRRYAALNRCLVRYFEPMRLKKPRWQRPPQQLSLGGAIASVRREHVKARSALEFICRSFGLILAMDGVADFWNLVAFFYAVADKNVPFSTSLSQAGWSLGISLRWLFLLAAASSATAKGNDTSKIMSYFLSECSSLLTEEELTEISCQVLNEYPVRVTVSGGYEVNGKLLCQMAVAGVTYVVILMQFQNDCGDHRRTN